MGNIDFRDPNIQIAGLVIFVALVIGYVFFFTQMLPFGYQPRSVAITELEQDYERISADLMKAKQTASRLPQVKEEYEQLSQQWEEAKTLLPTDKEMAELLSQVTVSGQRSGIEFLHFEPKAQVPRDIYVENPIEMKVSGGYHEIGTFLGRVSNLPRIVNVKSIDLKNVTNPQDPEAKELVEASLNLAAYTLMNEEARAQQQAQAAQAAQANQRPAAKGGRRGH